MFEIINHKLNITKTNIPSKDYRKIDNAPKEIQEIYHAKDSRNQATSHHLRVTLIH
jgi:hypothetical protein